MRSPRGPTEVHADRNLGGHALCALAAGGQQRRPVSVVGDESAPTKFNQMIDIRERAD
jgi:hypothetical protein